MARILSLLLALAVAAVPAAAYADAAADAHEKSADSMDKVICKKFLETGSLVKGYRVCKSKAEWQHDRDNIRAGINQSNSCARAAEGGQCF